MKEKIGNFTFCLFCMIAIFFIFQNNLKVANIIISAINLFLNKVFVSLFPMFILNDLLIAFSFPYYFYLLFNSIFRKHFSTSGICAYVFVMSLISGTPSNAYILNSLVENKKLTREEANHYVSFTYFSNPLFLTLMLGLLFPPSTTFKLILIHYTSNLIIAFLLRKKAPAISSANLSFSSNKIGVVLTKSIKRSVNTLLMILGTIVFYMLLSYIITSLFPFNEFTKVIFSGFLEITNGLNLLVNLKVASKLKEIIAISIISFGGLSIHTQIKSILEEAHLNYGYFLKGRIYQTMISILLVLIF